MKIVLGSDHAGVSYKSLLISHLEEAGHTCVDVGTHANDSVDYPDYAHPASTLVESGSVELGILICGSGNGVCMAANKHAGIRAALCWLPELASLARSHNDANILCLPARFVSETMAKEIVDAFLKASFEGGRHETRVQKIPCR
jgi:ribose 5-phosphate isomerase B